MTANRCRALRGARPLRTAKPAGPDSLTESAQSADESCSGGAARLGEDLRAVLHDAPAYSDRHRRTRPGRSAAQGEPRPSCGLPSERVAVSGSFEVAWRSPLALPWPPGRSPLPGQPSLPRPREPWRRSLRLIPKPGKRSHSLRSPPTLRSPAAIAPGSRADSTLTTTTGLSSALTTPARPRSR